jgi:DNA-binding LytR/AlgR family response regulator
MKTIVIEDEGAARRRLEKIVQNHAELTFGGSAGSGAEAIQLLDKSEAELLLMDIQLKDMTAFEVLKNIQKDFSGNIIFVTAYNEFAIKAFEVFAIDYVLKPYSEDRILNAISRCLRVKSPTQKEVLPILESLHFPDKICIPEGKISHLFPKDAIERVEAENYYSRIHTIDGNEKLIRILLKDLHQILPDNYLRINRSEIINKNHIISYKEDRHETTFVLKSGRECFGKRKYF